MQCFFRASIALMYCVALKMASNFSFTFFPSSRGLPKKSACYLHDTPTSHLFFFSVNFLRVQMMYRITYHNILFCFVLYPFPPRTDKAKNDCACMSERCLVWATQCRIDSKVNRQTYCLLTLHLTPHFSSNIPSFCFMFAGPRILIK